MSREEKQGYHHGNLRCELIRAAVELIDEGGIPALSLRAAARKAGVSVAAPYRHFESKQELLGAVASEGFRRFGKELSEAIRESSGDPFDRLTAIGRRYVRFALENTAFMEVMFGSELADPAEGGELQESSDQAYACLQRTVEACHAEIGVEGGVDVTAAAAWSLVHGLSTLLASNKFRNRHSAEQIDGMTDAVLDRFEQGLRALKPS